ncbi:MAG: hypothetical protein ACP5N7_00295 [Candidatus Pacearchaeota archaeon]
MNIETYQTLTGLTVTNEAMAEAMIKKTRLQLETLLGYPLLKNKVLDNHYEELGKVQNECNCDIDGTLNDPDEVISSYRLFNYNKNDEYLLIDPFIRVHAVKLVYIKMGSEPNGVTLKTFAVDEIRVHRKGNISKYIQNCENCSCVCECNACVQLAVDADWFYEDCIPDDLQMIWADMIKAELDPATDIRSETLGTHSYTKFDKSRLMGEQIKNSVLNKYTGPNGSLYRVIA